jgi:hypothetical protein
MYVQNCVVAILNTEPDVPIDKDNEVNREEANAQPVDPLLKNVRTQERTLWFFFFLALIFSSSA